MEEIIMSPKQYGDDCELWFQAGRHAEAIAREEELDLMSERLQRARNTASFFGLWALLASAAVIGMILREAWR